MRFNAVTGQYMDDEPLPMAAPPPQSQGETWLERNARLARENPDAIRTDEEQDTIEREAAPLRALSRVAQSAERVGDEVSSGIAETFPPFDATRLEGPLALASGAASTATFGGIDNAMAGLRSLKRMDQGESWPQAFEAEQRNQRDARNYLERSAPAENLVGRVGGAFATPSLAGTSAVQNAGGFTRALVNIGEGALAGGTQEQGEGRDFNRGALMGGGVAGGVQVLGRGAGALRNLVSRGAQDLPTATIGAAGGTPAQIRELLDTPPQNINGRELSGLPAAAARVEEAGILRGGFPSPKTVAERAVRARDEVGQAIGDQRRTLDAQGNDVYREEVLGPLEHARAQRSGRSGHEDSFDLIDDQMQRIESPRVAPGMPAPASTMSLDELAQMNANLRPAAGYIARSGRPITTDQRTAREVGHVYRSAIVDSVRRRAGDAAADAYRDNTMRYGVLRRIAPMAEGEASREASRLPVGLHATMAAAAAPGGLGIKAAAGAIAQAVRNRAKPGRYQVARGAANLDELIRTPAMQGFARMFQGKTPQARAAAHYALSMQNPAYRVAVEQARQPQDEAQEQPQQERPLQLDQAEGWSDAPPDMQGWEEVPPEEWNETPPDMTGWEEARF